MPSGTAKTVVHVMCVFKTVVHVMCVFKTSGTAKTVLHVMCVFKTNTELHTQLGKLINTCMSKTTKKNNETASYR